ncbi:MAG: hypothetical protein WCK67_09505 [bacterium]
MLSIANTKIINTSISSNKLQDKQIKKLSFKANSIPDHFQKQSQFIVSDGKHIDEKQARQLANKIENKELKEIGHGCNGICYMSEITINNELKPVVIKIEKKDKINHLSGFGAGLFNSIKSISSSLVD